MYIALGLMEIMFLPFRAHLCSLGAEASVMQDRDPSSEQVECLRSRLRIFAQILGNLV